MDEIKIDTLVPAYALEKVAPLGRVGVIALATDFNIEHDLKALYPDDVRAFTSRVRNVNPLTVENLRSMAPGISAAADCILPNTDLDVIIYACTSGTVAIGSERVTELVHKTRPGVAVTNPVIAAQRAFEELGARKLSILTPYTKAVNREIGATFSALGYEVLNIAGFGFEDDTAMTYISPEDIAQAAISNCDPDADLLFISCTALRATSVLARIELALDKPVVTSNQALVWHSLRLLKYPKPIRGFGVLLEQFLVK
ncbi:Asp/Glu racemase [Enterovibrio sp. ZSDZ35]|uniref:Asp/Glu racemase n=1 Tax=Enterovibrio qingdaonensis TaxID=2899818 RepID=A0ABT5QLR1_9GAMM|nr:Asp/Glu racemase [Enterovibrio sp. ZSDZ35]MDD1781917.1 Asp/Glu racemase [Enterovibrio sp. ZSDZ35]